MFAVCVAVWYRVSNILNLAVGDFAMVGALGVDNLYRVKGLPLPVAIITTLAVVAVFAYVYDQVVLRIAQDGRRPIEGIVITFFFTFALSFFIDGVAKLLFGTDVHAAPTLWSGPSLTAGQPATSSAPGLLVLACAIIIGGAFWLYIRFTLGGKALEASGENSVGARIVGIDTRQYRRLIFVGTAVIAAVFGIVESPITGFTYLSGATISLTGFLAAAYGGFRKPGRALVAGLFIGVLEALLGGYVSAQYGDTVLYAILAAADPRLAARPRLRIGGERMNAVPGRVLADLRGGPRRSPRPGPRGGCRAAACRRCRPGGGALIVLASGSSTPGRCSCCRPATRSSPPGMAVQIGFSQQIAFCQSVFFGVGAYGVAMLNTHLNMSVLLATVVMMVGGGAGRAAARLGGHPRLRARAGRRHADAAADRGRLRVRHRLPGRRGRRAADRHAVAAARRRPR